MTTIESKQFILKSLNSMDNVQTEKVLDYVRNLLLSNEEQMNYERFKEAAIQEINDALLDT